MMFDKKTVVKMAIICPTPVAVNYNTDWLMCIVESRGDACRSALDSNTPRSRRICKGLRQCTDSRKNIKNEMYFLKRGLVQVFSEKTGSIYRNMEAGTFFGEIALVYKQRRTASILTLTYCELFVLHKDDFKKVLEHYPDFASHVIKIAKERYETKHRE